MDRAGTRIGVLGLEHRRNEHGARCSVRPICLECPALGFGLPDLLDDNTSPGRRRRKVEIGHSKLRQLVDDISLNASTKAVAQTISEFHFDGEL